MTPPLLEVIDGSGSCRSAVQVNGSAVVCEKEARHCADGSTVFAFHAGRTPDGIGACWTDAQDGHCFVVVDRGDEFDSQERIA